MSAFQTQTDIGNRAAQHCGAPRMGLQGFNEISRTAGEVSACYAQLRQAELRANLWTFACRRAMLRAIDENTMLLVPALWVETTTYFVGSIVGDQFGTPWISRIPNNLGLQPSIVNSAWEPYFGPMTVALWDDGESYFAGELVYTTAGDGRSRVFVSLQTGNEDNPATSTAWDATATYSKNDVVTFSSVAYISLIDLNANQTPTGSAAAWNSLTTYSIGQAVTGSDGARYTSVGGGNVGNDPILDATSTYWTNTGILTPWSAVFVGGSGSVKWRQIGGSQFPMGVGLTTLDIVYPLGTGPSSQASTRNIFMLPAGYLGPAPQNPGAGVVSWLGGPSGFVYRDWAFENGYLLTQEAGPLPFRFVADVADVRIMDPMFCEGFAARIGMEVCETITQSNVQVGTVAKIYDEWITRAKNKNAIEQGADEAPDDDYLTVRY